MSRQGLMNWTQEELMAFFTAVESRQEQLFTGGTGPTNKARVEAAWMDVANECAALGHSRFENRSVKQLRADLYQKKKTDVLKKLEKARLANLPPPILMPHEEIILRLAQRFAQAENSMESSGDASDIQLSLNHNHIATLQDLLLPPMQFCLKDVKDEEAVPECPPKRPRVKASPDRENHVNNSGNGIIAAVPPTLMSALTTAPQARSRSRSSSDEKTHLELQILRTELQTKNEELKIRQQELLHKQLLNFQLLTALQLPATITVDGSVRHNEFHR